MNCCERPDVIRMDFKKGSVIDFVRWQNRMCRKCGRHWYGPDGEVKEFTRQEWDSWISSPEAA